jgi:thiol-disulfide isomerase/thioredoxin
MKTDILLVIAFFIYNCAQAEDTIKQTLPSVMVKTLDEKPVNIQDYGKTGKITILFFWETFCNPSIRGLDNILDVYDDWQTKYKCNLVGINMDDSRNSSKVKPLVNGKGWPYTILTDVNNDLSRALSISTCPYILLIDQKGNIVYRHTGFAEGFENELEVQIKALTN